MNVQVTGAGSFGLSLARVLARRGHDVRLCCRQEDGPEELRRTRHSPHFVQDMELPQEVEVSLESDPDVEMVVLAVPSHVMRTVLEQNPFSGKTIHVSVAKGIENETLYRMSEVIHDVAGDVPVASISGPSHAEEVAKDLPTTVTAASVEEDVRLAVQEAFMSPMFRVYTSPDHIGVELGGSLKNVIALAAGICDGFELGDSAKAAVITRGLAEISRLGTAMGADPLTFAGLSGMGDLIATCESRHSRNRAVGEKLARGSTLEEILGASLMVAEGVRTARAVHALSEQYKIEMPISDEVYKILFEGAEPVRAINALMMREAKPERL
jgi:glycerol-3-phosphate dehydrogenase (NAD(P)+)